MDIGHTQYFSPFIAEVKSATANNEDDAKQTCWGEVTEPSNDVIRPDVVQFAPLRISLFKRMMHLPKLFPKREPFSIRYEYHRNTIWTLEASYFKGTPRFSQDCLERTYSRTTGTLDSGF